MTPLKPITLTKGTVIQTDCVLCLYSEAQAAIRDLQDEVRYWKQVRTAP
jgi:hypothetical protein